MRAWLLPISAWASFHSQDLHSFHQLHVLIAVVAVGVEGREPQDSSHLCPLLLLHGQVGIHPSTQPLWHAPALVCRARLSGPLSFVKDMEIIINYENHSARARAADPRCWNCRAEFCRRARALSSTQPALPKEATLLFA